ncbi:xin actin-binding repeat-containing protein 2 isoform X1 [Coregonus clupeaformis]|uniref:xin actin-binding repeat-containing protein 2 isoform X1 n=1 Tax=Coregonus clupeaformis TaxID=59861 RepID=UPI001E1C472C|nr:xin actin-binding repeat-containing protein 2 isoform X1 [Coregonus clupeaformis]
MAMYLQTAVSKQQDTTFSSEVMEESEVCSVPGGLASIRAQFENQETATLHNISQFHFHRRAVQEVQLNSDVTMRSSSREVIPASQQDIFHQDEQVTHEENSFASSYENNHNDEREEEGPRLTTKELRDHFERTIEEAAPSKPMKIGRADINRSQWASNISQKQVSSSEIQNVSSNAIQNFSSSEINNVSSSDIWEDSATEAIEDTSAIAVDYEDTECFPPPPPEDLEYFPPPPPDLLQVPSESPDMPVECYLSPEPPESAYPSKRPLSRQEYFRQRNQNELKRLYKHIHPEVRKNIEMYSDAAEYENTQQESQEEFTGETRYIYDDNGSSPNDCISPEEEYLEWDEILRGEVQSMRWMFENKPLDAIKDDASNEDGDQNMEQEMIVGSDVRSKAWMFETKHMDALGSDNIASTKYRHKFNKLDKGDVRAAAWLFENQPMETLNKMHGDEELTKEIVFTQEDGSSTIHMLEFQYMETLGHTETIDDSHLLSLRSVLEEIKGEVKTITSTFESQFMCVLIGQSGQMLEITSIRKVETEKGETKTSTWLFETQALDMTNKPSAPVKLVCSLSMEDNYKDVHRGRWLFETKTLDSINKDEWESSMLQKEEIIGADVRKHCLAFETQPMDSLKDDANAGPRTIGGNVRSARHFFETSPKAALKDLNEVGRLKKLVSTEEKGDVRHQKLMFENERLENIRDEKKEIIRTVNFENLTEDQGTSYNADVHRNCMVFETQAMDTLKDDSNARALSKAEIVRGNVRSARHYFETAPADNSKDLAEVGKLQKMVRLDEEKGDVRHQKWVFESQPLEHIQEEKKEIIRTVNLEEIDKVDVSNYKQIFETTDLTRWDESQKILVEGVTCGSVKSNKHLFESTPMYAMQDSSGHYHEVKTVHREEVVKGDVTSCKWMFETSPIDQSDESITNYQVIKGISKEEVESGDVKTAKWLFETQPLDAIKYFSNIEDEETTTKEGVEIIKGDVKTGRWLFETELMNVPYEKDMLKSENESEEIRKGDVKTCTWLFETQALDTIRDETETVLQTCTVNQEDVQGKDVRMARFLFETENLENITGEGESFKRVTEIDIQSGDVNSMKYIFENQSSDIMTSTSEEFMQSLKTTQSTTQSEDIQKGNVVNCKWLFENQSIDAIRHTQEEALETRTVTDVQGGNVDKGRFIFETYSLDKIQEVSSEIDITKLQKITCEEEEKGDVRNYTMMFETQPLYAIQDKDGHYHEVTTVTSEEILKGDVIGSRWLFETKPLDSIRDRDEVYIIKSVTQEDVKKGDVTSAKWRFETQPLDKIAEDIKMSVKTVEDIQGGDVRMNKQRFESDELSQKSVQTVNVSEIQKGDVRTAKWMFETQTMDKIHSQSEENLIETVMKEEVLRGDVRQSVWLFEQNPLDHIKEIDEDDTVVVQEEIPKADVKKTTWLFETTPFHDFNENSVEKSEILGKSIKGTLEELYSQKIVNSKGILIEADEIGDVRMAKYQLMNKDSPEIQREEIISGDLSNIMMNLLNCRERIERGVVIESEEKGNISTTVHQLFNQERDVNVEKEEIVRGDIQEAVNNLLKEGGSAKRGILLQEDEKGDVRMTIYSLLNKEEDIDVEKEDIIKGNIRNALQRLSNPENQEQTRIKVDEKEKGNVNFYSTCIESGALDYLKQLQVEPDETPPEKVEKEEIIRGDIKGTKLILDSNRAQIERTVDEEDIVRGDVHNSVKVFMTEPTLSLDGLQKEEIVRGDLKAAMNSLSQSVNQTVVVEKEEVVRGNIHKARRHLELAQRRPKEVEKPEIVRGNIKGALRSLEKSATSKIEVAIEDFVPGDIKGTLKSLEQAKQTVREIEKEEIVKGNIHTAKQCLQYASNNRRTGQQEIDVQGNVRGTIELLLEPPASPRMTRRPSFEGDVKMSIKSLYETHEVHETGEEQTQPEKEEVIKGDVKGTIKSLLESAQRAAPKIRVGARRVKVPVGSPLRSQQGSPLLRSQQGSPDCSVINKTESETLKNRSKSNEAQRNLQKIKTANSVKTESSTQENQSLSTQTTMNTSESQTTQQSTKVMQHTTITQNHGIKTLETKFRNLNSSRKGMIRLDKTKVKTNVLTPTRTLSESELSLPPPPPPCDDQSSLTPASSINRLDLDLPPPPTPTPPPPVDSEPDHFPPPPPLQDFLPPPPSQHELDSMSSQTPHQSLAKATKVTVKKVKGPALHQVSKLEPTGQIQKIQQATSEKHTTIANKSVVEISKTQIESTSFSSKTVSSEIPKPPESPRPLKKVYVAPIRFTPPPSPPPFMKSTRFKTPLIKAEEKYRKQKVGSTPPATPSPIFMHESVTVALEMLSSEETSMEQSNKSMFGFTQENAEKTVTNVKVDTQSSDFSKHAQISDTPLSTTLISAVNGQNLPESAVISATKHHIVSNETSKVSSVQHQTTSISSTKQQTVTATKQQVTSASTEQSHSAVSSSQVQISTSDAKKVENTKRDVRKDVKNLKTNSQVQISTSDAKKVENTKQNVKNLKTNSQVQISTSDPKKVENTKRDVRKDVKNLKTNSQVQISTSDAKKVENTKQNVKNLKTNSQVQISTSDPKKVENTKRDVRKDVKNLKTNSLVQISTSDAKKVENTKQNVKNLKTNSQVQISTSDPKKVEDTKTDAKKDVKNLKTKDSHKSEDKKNKDNSASHGPEKVSDQPTKTEKVTQETIVKAAKSPSEDKKSDNSVSQAPEKVPSQSIKVEKVTSETNVKTGKKKAKGQEKQVEVKDTKQPDETKKENISQVKDVKVEVKMEVKDVTKVKVSSEQTHHETEDKVKEDSQKALAVNDNQPATPTPARKKKKKKKKKKSSKAKDAAASAESTKSVSESSTQSQEITVVQTHKAHQEEHIQVHKEVIITESKVHQSIQEQETVKVKKQVKACQKKKEVTANHQIQEKPKEEYRNVPVKVESEKITSQSAQKEQCSTGSTEDSQRREHVQKLISHITELEGASGQMDSKSVKTLLNTIPEWLIGSEENIYLEGTAVEHNIQKLTEIVSYVKILANAKLLCLEGTHTTLEKHESEPTSEKIIVGGATKKIRKISISSSKVESQKKVVESKKTSHESKKQELSAKSIDHRAPSPLLQMRSPSPNFITIETTQRTDSPRRITPSPIPMHRPATLPTPPPRILEPPTSRINRATPSPTFSRAENLARIKDTTAQLSRGVTAPPVPLPMQVTENTSEIVESPASFHQQIKIEEQAEETSEVLAKTIVTAKKHKDKKQKKELSEEAQKADVKVTGGRSFHQMDKEDMEASEISEYLMVTTSVRDKREFFEEAQKAAENKTYVRKDPVDIPEHLGQDMEEPKTTNQESKDETQSTSEKVTENSTEVVGSTESTDKELMEASEMSESSIVTRSVSDKREFFEEAQKAEINKTYVRKYPIDILEHLGPAIMEPETENQERKEDVQNTTEQITEKISEEVGFMWEDRWESAAIEAMETSELSDSSAVTSVRDKREFFEETHKAKVNKTYVRKDPIDTPERLGPDMEELEPENQENEKENLPKVDLSGLVNKFETPEEKVYVRKPITMRERCGSEMEYTESDIENTETQEEEMPTFDIKAIKNVFEMSEQSPSFKEEKNQLDELESNLSENTTDSSKQDNTQETQRGSGQISPMPSQKKLQHMSVDPTDFSETKSVTQHFSSFDEFVNKTIGSLSSTTVSQHSKSVTTHRAPFSNADMVKKKVSQVTLSETPDEAFHKTWPESESVFKSLGYSVSEERTSHVVSHQTKTVVTDSSSQVGALHCMSEEGLSDGGSNSGQKKIP